MSLLASSLSKGGGTSLTRAYCILLLYTRSNTTPTILLKPSFSAYASSFPPLGVGANTPSTSGHNTPGSTPISLLPIEPKMQILKRPTASSAPTSAPSPQMSIQDRQAAYKAARERIFKSDSGGSSPPEQPSTPALPASTSTPSSRSKQNASPRSGSPRRNNSNSKSRGASSNNSPSHTPPPPRPQPQQRSAPSSSSSNQNQSMMYPSRMQQAPSQQQVYGPGYNNIPPQPYDTGAYASGPGPGPGRGGVIRGPMGPGPDTRGFAGGRGRGNSFQTQGQGQMDMNMNGVGGSGSGGTWNNGNGMSGQYGGPGPGSEYYDPNRGY